MVECVLAVCAETAILDRLANGLSLINVLEGIAPETFPIVIPRLTCVFVLTRDANDPDSHPGIVTIGLAGQELLRGPAEVSFRGQPRARAVLTIQNLIVPTPGTMTVALLLGDGSTPVGHWDILFQGKAPQLRLPLASDEQTHPA